jgi:hypothetical protein
LRKSELEQVLQAASEAIQRDGKIKLLFVLDHFEGWETDADWGDMNFYLKHDKDIEMIAIVGKDQWRDHSLMFAGAGLRKADVEYFTLYESDRALAWLAESPSR